MFQILLAISIVIVCAKVQNVKYRRSIVIGKKNGLVLHIKTECQHNT